MHRALRYNSAALNTSRQRRACVTHPSALCCGGWLCLSEYAVRNPPSTSLRCCSMCDRPIYYTNTLDGNIRTVWIKYGYLYCPSNSDVLCFLAEAHRIILDIKQHAQNTNNATTPPTSTSSSGGHTTRVSQVCDVLLWPLALSEAAIRDW